MQSSFGTVIKVKRQMEKEVGSRKKSRRKEGRFGNGSVAHNHGVTQGTQWSRALAVIWVLSRSVDCVSLVLRLQSYKGGRREVSTEIENKFFR